jgi:vesicle coat complex subunit
VNLIKIDDDHFLNADNVTDFFIIDLQDDKGNPIIYIIKLTIEDSKKITLEESDSYKYEKTIGTYKYSKDTITYKRESLVEIEDEKDKLTEYTGENLTSKIKVIDSHNLKYTYKSKELLLTKI